MVANLHAATLGSKRMLLSSTQGFPTQFFELEPTRAIPELQIPATKLFSRPSSFELDRVSEVLAGTVFGNLRQVRRGFGIVANLRAPRPGSQRRLLSLTPGFRIQFFELELIRAIPELQITRRAFPALE